MDTFMKADIFFFVTTLAVVFISIFIIIAIVYFIRFLGACRRLTETLEEKAGELSEEAEEFLERIKGAWLFNLLFPPKKRQKKEKKN